ncbi:hypothetical protein XA3_15380 [Xylocopilactobacillus apicola]|uniref:WxL domain-containing protein n=2 Tax=Xylocopilactobacillus apicola TaxID=2932184 RepID=A0AAU9DPK4_9LACO|nr:hypothetical protein XA3_15380 [Xylocopilactobacillus apicola]
MIIKKQNLRLMLLKIVILFSIIIIPSLKVKAVGNINPNLVDLSPASTNKGDIYAPFYGKEILPNVFSSATDDPRTQYDTPDPDDPANIAKFRVKTQPETDAQIKQRLTDGDVYGQIQRYKLEGETAYVSTPDELLNALWGRKGAYKSSDAYPIFAGDGSGAVAQVNITHIVLTKDIVFTYGTTVNGYQSFTNLVGMTGNYVPNRNIVIDGIDPRDPTSTKHTLDFNGSYNAARIDLNSNYFKSKFVFNNIILQGTDYFGPGSAVGNTVDKTVVYRNIQYHGSQLAASYYTDIIFTGYNDIKPSISYQTLQPVSSGATNSNGLIYDNAQPGKMTYAYGHLPTNAPAGSTETYYCQQIMESYNVTFAYNTKFDGFTPTDGAFVVGYYLHDGKPCNVNVMDYSEVNVSSTNQGSVIEYSYSATIQLWSGELEVHPHAVLNVNAYEFKNTSSGGDTNSNNITHNPNYTRDLINLTPQGGFNPNIKVDDYATLNGTQSGPIASAGLSSGSVGLGAGAALTVGKWGKFNIKSTNADMSTRPVLFMDNSAKVSVAQPGTFDLQGDGIYTGARSLIQLGSNATFEFNRARMVNIQYNGTQANTNLISMNPGQMHVQNMDVYAWNRGHASSGVNPDPFDNTDGKDYLWQSIFNFVADYNSAGFLNIDSTASSLFPIDIADMRTNYNTNKFQRVMFHYIPTVYFKDFTSQPVDGPVSDPNSYQITGKVVTDNINDPNGDYIPLEGAYVRLSGHVKNTDAASEVGLVDLDQPFSNTVEPDSMWSDLSSSGIDIKSKFSAMTAVDGSFTVTLPKVSGVQKTFMASDLNDLTNTRPDENGRIQAFAFKAGNYNVTNLAVLDRTEPIAKEAPMRYTVVDQPVLDPKGFVDTSQDLVTGLTHLSDLHPDINSNAFTKLNDYTFTFAAQNLASDNAFWQTPGVKDVYVNVKDPSGNTTVVKGQVTISASPVFIEIKNPNAINKIPSGSDNWTDIQWQNWVKTANPNGARALRINSDGTTTDISDQMTNNASAFGQKVNNIKYSIATGATPPAETTVSKDATIELRSDSLKFEMPHDSSNNPTALNFGRYGSYNTGYLNSKDTQNYLVKVLDDRVDQSPQWSVSVQASKFQETNPGNAIIPTDLIDLGLLDQSSNIFTDLVETSNTISQGTGNHDFDILTGNGLINSDQKLVISRLRPDSRVNGRSYGAKLTWTLVGATP